MKFNVLNNEPLQFFDANGVLIGTIEISGSGDMIIRPESGSSRDIILGNRDTVGDVEIGLPSAEANLKLMGGGTISANGNTLTIGDSTAGDSVIIAVPITASSVDTASFAITASHALNAGGGGGGSAFPFTGSANISGSLQIRGGSALTGATIFEIKNTSADAYDDLFAFDDNGKITHEVDGTGDKHVIQTTSGATMFKFGVSAGSQGYLQIQNNGFTGAYLNNYGGAFGYGATVPSSGKSLYVLGNAEITGSLTVSSSVIDFTNATAISGSTFSGSFQGDGSNLTGTGTTVVANPGSSGGGALSTITIGGTSFSVGGGGGGSSIFTAADGFQKTINNLIVSQSNTTSSLTVINSGSTVFDVRGSVGQLFEVQDGLDGVLMSVNDISGIPILTVSSSGDVILAEGSTLQGTAATASFVAGVSAAFPFAGAAIITGSLDITGSGDDIFKVRSSSGSLFSVDDGLDGILMSVNDISGLPLFEISSSGDVELVTGNISGSGISTASFGHLLVNGVSISGSGGGGGGGSVPAGTVSGSTQITELGFVTSSATASFITTSQTSSFMTSSLTGSFNNLTITNLSGSLIPGDGSTSSIAVTVVSTGAGNKYALDGTITASISLTAGNSYKFDQSDATNAAGGGHPFRFSTDTGGSSNYSTGVTINGSPGSAGAYTQISVTNSTPTLYYYCTNHANMGLGGTLSIITGSQIQNGFLEVSGSTRLSGSLDVLTDITASGNISSTNITSSGYMLITSSNTGGSGNGSMTPGLVINQLGSSQNHSGPAIRLVAENGEETNIYHQRGGSGADNGNALNILSGGGINIEAGDDLGSGNKFFRIAKGQALFTIDDDSSAPRTDVKIHNANGGTAYSRLSLGASSQYWYIEADDNSTPFNIGFDNGSSDTDVITFTKHDGSLTGSLTITGSLTVSGSDLNLISGSFRVVSPTRGTMLNIDNNTATLGPGASAGGGYTAVAIGHNASTGNNYSVSIGSGATTNNNQYAVAIGGVGVSANGLGAVVIGGNTVTAGNYGISMGYQAIGSGDYSINLGRSSRGTGANSVTFNTSGDTVAAPSNTRAFNLYLSDGTGNPDLVISASNESRLSGSSFVIESSGSTLFEVIGSEGTIFSLDDELDGTLFTVNDRSGIPQFEVSSSGLVEVGEGPLKLKGNNIQDESFTWFMT